MELMEKLAEILGFNRKKGEFELLETEAGSPGIRGGWNEGTKGKKTPDINKTESSLDDCISRIREEFRQDINPDLLIRRFSLCGKINAAAVFINGMAKNEVINDFILRAGVSGSLPENMQQPSIDYFVQNVFCVGDAAVESSWKSIKDGIIDGKTAVFIDGEISVPLFDTRGYEHRAVNIPQNEKLVRGPQEGFNENLRTNITLLRRIIRREDLVCEYRTLGSDNNQRVGIMYLHGSANEALVGEVKRRIAKIDTRMVVTSGILEQLTEKHKLFPLPQLLATERPDRAAAHILQGYVVVLIEGSPFVNIMPTTLFTLMASPEDTYFRKPEGSIIRLVRYMGALISVLLPGYFLALSLYHQGMMSTEVLSTMVISRKMVFAPIVTELIFLLAVFQLIREAGLRVPGSIGQAIGIIGGLILGQAAVSANLASSVLLIVVALSGLGNFCIPDYSTQIAASYARLAFVLAAWMSGLLGLCCTLVAMICYLASVKSCGVPFLAPVAPRTYSKRPPILRGVITMHKKAEDYTNTREEA